MIELSVLIQITARLQFQSPHSGFVKVGQWGPVHDALSEIRALLLVLNGLITRVVGTLPFGLTLVMLDAGISLLICAAGYFVGGELAPWFEADLSKTMQTGIPTID